MTSEKEREDFAVRLNALCDDMQIPPKGKNRQESVAKQFHVTQKGARKWLEGEGFPNIDKCIVIARWANCSFEWLMTGRGLKQLDAAHPLVARYEASDPATRALIDLALERPSADIPEGMSDSLRTLVLSARDWIAKQIGKA